MLTENGYHCGKADCKTCEDQKRFEAEKCDPVIELCRRLYVELFYCDQQMTQTLNEDDEPIWTTGSTVRKVLSDAKAMLDGTTPQPCSRCAELAQDLQTTADVLAEYVESHRNIELAHANQYEILCRRTDEVIKSEQAWQQLDDDRVEYINDVGDILGQNDTDESLLNAAKRVIDRIDEQLCTIKALNMALGGEYSTSTENLIDANEVDYGDLGLIALCRELTAENVKLTDITLFQKSGWTTDYEELNRANAVIEKCKELLHWVDKYVGCAIGESIKEALAAIAEYQKGGE